MNGRQVLVEFLQNTDDPAKSARLETVDGEGVSAMQILHAGMVHDWFEERSVTLELPDGKGMVKEVVRYADAVSFIVLKAVSFAQRHENKDVADLVHVMRYAGTLQDLAEAYGRRMVEGRHVDALTHGLAALHSRFCDEDGTEGYTKSGPAQFTLFHEIGTVGSDERIREQRDVSGLVTTFVDLVNAQLERR